MSLLLKQLNGANNHNYRHSSNTIAHHQRLHVTGRQLRGTVSEAPLD